MTNPNRVDNGKSLPPPPFGRPAKGRILLHGGMVAAPANSNSMPWDLPEAKEQNASGVPEPREALDKMMGGNRCGGCLWLCICVVLHEVDAGGR